MTKILNDTSPPNIPWEEKPELLIKSLLRRYSGNHVIERTPCKGVSASSTVSWIPMATAS